MLSARSRLQVQSSERTRRVAAAEFLSRSPEGGVDEQAGCTASGAVLRDRETRLGRRAGVLLCDACLTKHLQAEPADTEAARLKQQRQNRTKKTGEAGEGPIAPATAPTAAAAVAAAAAAASAAAAAQPATQGKGSKTAASSKRKRAGLRLRTTAGAAAALAKQGLSNMQAEEVRAVERAMAGEAVRCAVGGIPARYIASTGCP
jgi:transposase